MPGLTQLRTVLGGRDEILDLDHNGLVAVARALADRIDRLESLLRDHRPPPMDASVWWGRITAVAGVDGAGIGTIDSVRYSVRPLYRPEVTQDKDNIVPDGGRAFAGPGDLKIRAAEVDDPVLLFKPPAVNGDTPGPFRVFVLTETIADPEVCTDGGGSGPGGGIGVG